MLICPDRGVELWGEKHNLCDPRDPTPLRTKSNLACAVSLPNTAGLTVIGPSVSLGIQSGQSCRFSLFTVLTGSATTHRRATNSGYICDGYPRDTVIH